MKNPTPSQRVRELKELIRRGQTRLNNPLLPQETRQMVLAKMHEYEHEIRSLEREYSVPQNTSLLLIK